ncbi:MAG: hypothetical protein LBQ60_01355 [Bacteroidales bacterium]|nr:hypothetical protein [Bacteroidales bacterium]
MDKINRTVYLASSNIISSLGYTTADNMDQLFQEHTGIHMVRNGYIPDGQIPLSLVNDVVLEELSASFLIPDTYTRLEKMILVSVTDALKESDLNISGSRCVFVVSTTKGNVDLLPDMTDNSQTMLWCLGERIRSYFGNPNHAVVISNACISGVLAIEAAARMLRTGLYDHAVVTGGDVASPFVISGFNSFRALSDQACKPYDKERKGLTLGEGCATMILSTYSGEDRAVCICGGSMSTDAVHISAPDRTGAGLASAIENTLYRLGINHSDIDAVCAHGTATVYNDDMEAHAFDRTRLSGKPVYSLKGYWGHTLGAAGIMECIAAACSLKKQTLFRTLGFDTPGTVLPLNVTQITQKANLRYVLKTASGFGGCNAALVMKSG